MAWIESHQALRLHPKTRKLARRVGGTATAVGHLHCLWWWALDYAPDGDLSRFSDEEIADGAEWAGDPTEFVTALRDSGFVDVATQSLHDWSDYGGKVIYKRVADAARKRKKKAGGNTDSVRVPSGIPPESDRIPTGVRSESQVEDRQTDRTDKGKDMSPPAEPPSTSFSPDDTQEIEVDDETAVGELDYSPEFEAFWSVYPSRHPAKSYKARAWRAWKARRNKHVGAKGMTKAGANYAAACVGTEGRYIMHASTFLGPDMPFTDWVMGTPSDCVPANGNGMTAAQIWSEAQANEAKGD